MKKKIAVLTSSDLSKVQGSTEARYIVDFLSENYDVHIYTTSDPEISGAKYHKLPTPSLIPALFLYNIILFPYFLCHTVWHEFDIFYTYSGFHLTPFLISTLCECKWIADFQTKPTGQAKEWRKLSSKDRIVSALYYGLIDKIYQITLPHAKSVITLSEPIRNHLHQSYKINPERIQLVPLGVDSEKFRPNRLQTGYTEPLDIVYIGSIASQREMDICIRALASEELDLDVRLHFVGDGPEEYLQQLWKIARKSGVEDRVEWYGYVSHDSIPEILNEMDVAISPLPAHDSYEVSSPAKIYEYLSMGLPIICSDIRAHNHLLTEGKTGFFFEASSQDSLVTAINRIGELDSSTWQNIREETREEGKRQDWSTRLETIQAIIDE